ncbi:peptide chain release factor N(5)-glutamine methyltransferase [Breoghania sp.]|uniref:peptide chain release factor N(5)-glutamine methyltransferase n=1 Tax=Breoghania sp. TaxID=2065378 RepID=UPI002AA95F18|nr:peptide chain release factor N(5)-glutamine methyltransferase [Breoghania sp.]
MSETLGAACRRMRNALRDAGFATSDLDARLLAADVVGLDPNRIVLEESRSLSAEEISRLNAHLEARLSHRPVGRILGRREFWGLEFSLSPETLEPRPDTETLVESALDLVGERARAQVPLRILDLGTGTGAILISLLHELPNAWGLASDIQPGALETARRNAVANGVGDRASFVCMSWMDAVSGPWDLIVSNPPYIRSAVIDDLDEDVRAHDPMLALDGGEDGLAPYRILVRQAFEALGGEGGALVLEIGFDQGREVSDLCRLAGFGNVMIRRDLAGCDRVVVARRQGR